MLPPTRVQNALALLWQAHLLAEDLQRQVWDLAVEIDCLRACGLSNSDLRWLLGRSLVEHAHETTAPGEDQRTYCRLGKMTLTPATCFVLTPAGIALAGGLKDGVAAERPVKTVAGGAERDGPIWDRDRQELRCAGVLVKQFKLPAPNQEIILAAFEEENWPVRIDDPLPGNPSVDAKRRLHETITSLNRHQKHRLIQFSGDGSGQGIRWCRIRTSQSFSGGS